ncbi:hypothetical protein SAMN05443665_1015129 [Actinomadura meyerae]|uniref:Uncharacterized protein n=1 Tax=Actinomadura meyerae TaxID=240840 RepID=A0A239JRL8_9ACTN|nr:hypothetical protein SAMN05443665_1015129 [Actinomadura meyerae]
MSPLRNPPSLRVECWNGLVFGSTSEDAGGGAAAASTARRAGVLRDAADRVPDPVPAVVLDEDVLRADVVRDFGADAFLAVLVRDVPDFDVPDFDALVRAEVVDRDRLDAAEVVLRDEVPDLDVPALDVPDLAVPDFDVPDFDVPDFDVPDFDVPALARDVPDLDVLAFEVLALDDELLRLAGELALDVLDLAVVVMTFAAASIALAASDIALVALVIALVIAVMALADEDALVATDFIWVAAVLAWLAALVTRVAAVDDVRLEVVDFFAVLLPVDLLPVDLVVVDRDDELAADVRLAAGFLAVVDLAAVVLFARPAVPRLVVVRDAVLVATDLPPEMISYGEIYSTLCDPLHAKRHIEIRRPPGARRSSSPEMPSYGRFPAPRSSRRGWGAGRASGSRRPSPPGRRPGRRRRPPGRWR